MYLQRRVCDTVSVERRNGPRPVLTIEEENPIANYVCEMTLRGMGLDHLIF